MWKNYIRRKNGGIRKRGVMRKCKERMTEIQKRARSSRWLDNITQTNTYREH